VTDRSKREESVETHVESATEQADRRAQEGRESPGSESPGSESPGSESPGSEAPGSEAPGSEAPGSDEEPSDQEELDPDELVVLADDEQAEVSRPRLSGAGARRKAKPADKPRSFTAEQRLLILDAWQRSKLAATDFAPLVGASPAVLYKWRRRFEEHGPAGLEERRGAPSGSKLSEVTRRAILLMKGAHPEWGQERLHHELLRAKGLAASAGAIARVLAEEGYEVEEVPTRPRASEPKRFERARPGQLWQTDLFTFMLKRQNRRVHLVAYLDDHSRFVVGYGLHATASGALVRDVFEAAIGSYGAPSEVLTDNGTQYVTWRGKSAFTKLCEKRGIKQVVASPRHPQTLGKIERFWGSLWRECLEAAVFLDLQDARARIGHFVDHYNFHRTHQGIDGAVPADRFFEAAPEVKATLAARVAKDALELAKQGLPRKPFYLTGRVGDVGISLHAEGERVVLTREDGSRETVDLSAPGRRASEPGPVDMPAPLAPTASPSAAPGSEDGEEEPAPGTSPLDDALRSLERGLGDGRRGGDAGEAAR
jgi:transposase InsO family protein